MAMECTACGVNKAPLHPTPERAIVANLAHVLGRVAKKAE